MPIELTTRCNQWPLHDATPCLTRWRDLLESQQLGTLTFNGREISYRGPLHTAALRQLASVAESYAELKYPAGRVLSKHTLTLILKGETNVVITVTNEQMNTNATWAIKVATQAPE